MAFRIQRMSNAGGVRGWVEGIYSEWDSNGIAGLDKVLHI
jgi:hypothetical protein